MVADTARGRLSGQIGPPTPLWGSIAHVTVCIMKLFVDNVGVGAGSGSGQGLAVRELDR